MLVKDLIYLLQSRAQPDDDVILTVYVTDSSNYEVREFCLLTDSMGFDSVFRRKETNDEYTCNITVSG